eukprot:CAMPEP_0184868022 /NCGR_PEP_ID=MMETSP0580-20130426/28784_1 /TAXON_ID=1118495 /ORGANISM="Dactyliosolen fragilissimus" /LENGTH=259 /DNA_ID=CAMNT_0027368631 /DNA_START=285 /DNA_END=1064 /DNA_ORIENTATION=-
MMITGLVGMTFFTSPHDRNDSSRTKKYLVISGNDVEGMCILESNLEEPLLTNAIDGRLGENDPSVQGHENNNLDQFLELESDKEKDRKYVKVVGFSVPRRILGIILASCDGFLGGSALVPMHYSNAGGLEYTISFGIGAGIVTGVGWILRYIFTSYQNGSFKLGYKALPSMYIRDLWLHGSIAGILWSVGNIGNILSVTYLGEGMGMSMVQNQLLVSGLWGILIFQEIKGFKAIIGWALSAGFTILSIGFLSHEHENSK